MTIHETLCHGGYLDFNSGDRLVVDGSTTMDLAPWTYRILLAGNDGP